MFQIRTVGDQSYVGVPTNLPELVREHYLFTLFAESCLQRKLNFHVLNQEFMTTLPTTDKLTSCLKGMGIPLFIQDIPKYDPRLKGSFKHGLFSALKVMAQGEPNLDIRIFRFGDEKRPIELILGSAWGTKYMSEKTILDIVITALKLVKLTPELHSYLNPVDELRKIYGLKLNLHLNKVISPEERNFLLQEFGSVIEKINNFQLPDITMLGDFHALNEKISKFIKSLRPYKNRCQEVIDARLKLIFSNKNAKRSKAKVPIEQSIERIKNTVGYINQFNPCKIVGCMSSFNITGIPSSIEAEDLIFNDLKKYLDRLVELGFDSVKTQFIWNWYKDTLSSS